MMETLTDPGVGLVTAADNHAPPEVVAGVAVKASAPEVLWTETGIAAGAVPESV